MKIVPVLSCLLGVVAGLLFGLLLWGQGQAPGAAPDAALRRDAEILGALRDLREAMDRQSFAARAEQRVESGAPTAGANIAQPLTPDATTSVEEFKRVLDQAVRDLRDLSVSGPASLATIEPSPDAPKKLAELYTSGWKQGVVGEDLVLLTPRDIYRILGKPNIVGASQGCMQWTYRQNQPVVHMLSVLFCDGLVCQVVRQDN